MLKSRQIGFSFVCTFITVALGLWLEQSHSILSTANKAWIAEIFESYMQDAIPLLLEGLRERNEVLKTLDLPKNSFSFDRTTLKYRLTEKSIVQLLGIDTMSDKNRGKGNVNLVIVDEAAYIQNSSIINMVIQPMLNFADGSRIYGSTTNGDNWFKFAYEQVLTDRIKDPEKYHALSYNLYTSGVYTEEKCDNIIMDAYKSHLQANPTLLPEDVCTLLAQEYFCYFTTLGKKSKLFPRFASNPDTYVTSHTTRPRKFNDGPERTLLYSDQSEFDVHFFIDYGGTSDPMAVLLMALNRYGQIIVFDEIYQNDCGIGEIIPKIREKEIEWGIKPRTYYIDRSAGNTSVKLSKTEAIKISEEFRKLGLPVTLVKYMRKRDRINLVNEYFVVYDHLVNPFTGEKPSCRLYISDLCINLIKQLSNLSTEKSSTNTTEQAKMYEAMQFRNMKNDHAVDALLYGVSELSGMSGNRTGDIVRSINSSNLQYPNRLLTRKYEKNQFRYGRI